MSKTVKGNGKEADESQKERQRASVRLNQKNDWKSSVSLRVTIAIIILQQQLFVQSHLLQFLAQFVQLTRQLLTLQLLQDQILKQH